ncbi:MAG: hypothetical protein H6623_06150 [Bdellovibrionaceae bacterium]|nr:hypothetical protein [Pseudobdellovibrionaceae bacterium]
MKKSTFHEILLEKMLGTAVSQPFVSPPTLTGIEREIPASFRVSIDFIHKSALNAYPKKKLVKLEPTPPTTPQIKPTVWIEKEKLNDEEKQKWNLFEKTIGENFNGRLTRSLAMSRFRTFIKKIHPDTGHNTQAYNFATLIKIKDEFIYVIDQYSKKNI